MKAEFQYYDVTEDGNEYEVYLYKDKFILFNYFYEYEWSVDENWYSSLEDAEDAIDKKIVYESLSEEERNRRKELIKEYNNLPLCSILEGYCPYDGECEKCELKKFYKKAKEDWLIKREKYKDAVNF